jgi:hypothetical protein
MIFSYVVDHTLPDTEDRPIPFSKKALRADVFQTTAGWPVLVCEENVRVHAHWRLLFYRLQRTV